MSMNGIKMRKTSTRRRAIEQKGRLDIAPNTKGFAGPPSLSLDGAQKLTLVCFTSDGVKFYDRNELKI